MKNIHGAKKGGGKQRQPVIAPDSAQSKAYIDMLYGLGEGEIAGLVNGYKSVYLDDTPLQNDNGEFNFPNVKVDFRSGTNDQTYIDGFADVASETAVNIELKHGTPWVKSFNNLDLDAVRVRLKWGALRSQNTENGDVNGVKIDYAIDVKTDNGGWVEMLSTAINAKTSDAYERSHRIDLPTATQGWQVRVRRLTPNSTSDFVSDKMYISAITEVIDLKLRYPNTALLGLRYDAESFSNVAKMSARCKGLIIKVPTNYDPVSRTYDGLWNGEFKLAYCNNPAWVYYDLCTATRYGLGGRLKEYMIDKWSLYRLAQYCDQMVDDGMGGTEPRFTVNIYIQSAEGAFEILSKLAGVFRAISYWDGTSIVLDADIPQDSMYSFSRANVIDGVFEYTGTRARDRHTVAKVAWDNPANHFKTEYEFVRDEKAIAKFGVRVADIQAWGCTSKGQAQRAGIWALKSEQLETRMVTFKVGLDGYIPSPAKVIEISDELFAGRATGGRVLAINDKKTVITLDRAITAKTGDTLVINGDDGTSQRRQIKSVAGDKITVTKAFGDISVENVWVLDSTDLATMKFRVLSVTADDNHQFTISAVQYNPAKYDAIDTGAYIDERPISVINPTVQAPAKAVNLSSYHTVNQGVSITTLIISWEQVTGAVKYTVEWRKDNGNWQTLPPTGTNSIEIAGVYAGQYEARVTAISAFGQASLATHSALTQVQGKTGKPNRPAFIRVTGKLFGMDVAWSFANGSDDTNFTEIQVSPDGRSNITSLGTFAYPTSKHEITGLQGNLTQFYRARIVDKLGNQSDWTAWVSGTTDARADKVLDIISGQIRDSHLDQSLRTPIAKIGGIESGLNGIKGQIPSLQSAISAINGQLPTLNTKIATTERHLQTAQSTLQTAVANITTERNRITSAIRDITALQNANNAKTTELANLTNTVNGHTSDIRELSVTTGDLSQKYTALKTATDAANSEITAIKQTQAGQATQLNTIKTTADKAAADLRTTKQTLANADTALGQRIDSLQSDYNGNKANIANQIKTLSDKDVAVANQISNLTANFTTANNKADAAKRTADDALGKANTANTAITAEQKARADADTALGQRISAIDTAYKSADSQTTAKLGQLEQSISNKDRAMAQRVDTLNANYTALDNRTKWTDLTTATDLNMLTTQGNYFITGARTNSPVNAWVYLMVDVPRSDRITQTAWADNAPNTTYRRTRAGTTWTAWEKMATGAELSTKATTASLNEFKQAQATKDTATTQKLSQLESGLGTKANATALNNYYTKAQTDQAIGGRVERFEASLKRQEINAVTDLNTLTTQGQYFIKAGNNPNAPATNWLFVDVETSNDQWIIMQTVRQDNNAKNQWVRQRYNGNWSAWEKVATGGELNDKASAAALNEFKQTQAEKDNASSQKLTQLQASLESVDNRTKWKEITTVTDLNNLKEQGNYFIKQSNNPNAPVINWVYVSVDKANNARIKQTVWADNHASNIYTRLWTDNRWLAWEQTPSSSDVANKASASALNELNTRVTQVDGKITAEANKVSQLQTTLNGQTTSIRNVEQSVNGVKAVKAVTVDNNGFISGYGLMSELQNGRVTSRFGINADQIYFGATTTAKKPFVFTTRTTIIDGVSYPAGAWLNSASIANASIKLAHIDKASIGNLSALSASIGHFKSSQTGARLEIKDSVLLVYDANNTLRVRLGLW